jgi:hypothetical protein
MFDGNGNWTSDFSAQADRDNGIKILASRFDNIFIADIKESFENCLTKDGQIAPIGNFNMGGQKITNLNAGTNDNDAVNKSQLDSSLSNLLSSVYPVGSIYIGTQENCPLATLISGSTWTKVATQVAISVPTSVSVYGNGKNLVFNNGVRNLGLCSNSSGDHTIAPQWTTSTNVAIGANVESYQATGGSSKAAGVVTNGSLSGLTGSIAASTYLTVNLWKRTA